MIPATNAPPSGRPYRYLERPKEGLRVPHIMLVTFHRGFPINYPRHLDHTANTVSYVTDQPGATWITTQQSAAVVAIADAADGEGIERAVDRLVAEVGRPDVVCASSEYDLAIAARLRSRLGVAGPTEEQTLRCQDKVRMKHALRAHGMPTPAFVECSSRDTVRDLTQQVGFPVVLKPRRGAASKGVLIVHTERQLNSLWDLLELDQYECEEFVPGPICHVDGLVQNGEIRFGLASRYVNTCLQSARGLPHGSVVLDDPLLSERLIRFAAESLQALGLPNSAFHLEIIMRGAKEPVFLEVGARPGGAEVQQMLEDLYGVDMLREWVNLQLGPIPRLTAVRPPIGGWLVVPAPSAPPYRVISAEPMHGQIPFLYHQAIPVAGDIHDATTLQQNRWPGGRFRYSGPSTAAVEAAIAATMGRYRVRVEPVQDEQARADASPPAKLIW